MFWVEEILEDMLLSVVLSPEVWALIMAVAGLAIFLGLRFNLLAGFCLILAEIAVTVAWAAKEWADCSRCNIQDQHFLMGVLSGHVFWEVTCFLTLAGMAVHRWYRNKQTTKEL
ncbi:MAG: hypothetical protein ACO1OX_05470 [Novosphingobium sp.]